MRLPCHDGDFRRLLDLLGVRLSDVLQANCVVWVEGPSDRIFLKKCIELVASDLCEGQHYQIAFYGGALLAHCSLGATDEGLVDLLKLCRHAAVIADSDYSDARGTLSPTKKRIQDAVAGDSGLFWITEGRETENYLSDRVIMESYRELLPKSNVGDITLGKFDRLENVIAETFLEVGAGDKWKVEYRSNKTRLMPFFMKNISEDDLNRWDLVGRLEELVTWIRKAN